MEPLSDDQYAQAIADSLKPQYLTPDTDVITEGDLSGEALGTLSAVSKKLFPDLAEDEYGCCAVSDLQKMIGVEQDEDSLQGKIQVTKRNGQYTITDEYDFQRMGGAELFEDFGTAETKTGGVYKMRGWAKEMMTKQQAKNFLKVKLPVEREVVEIDFDDDFVGTFKGPMTTARAKAFDKFLKAKGLSDG